ncbi:lantibiotic dehydratase [Rhodocytophaga aerolata]|uniref:Lantibiotic dehydratase n=1 Tax=Rhodocytophaga aerolata TaxID=455078 RepID=A0ABT8R624_9BACT|nr:lantibiotic dehydratase [Rhodocytophaga aerolata]MDO1446723.1 lantibiotic dehydratase [Rhodocytophaga aerolata]
MQVFPYILTRIGGGSLKNLTQVNTSQLLGCLEKLQALQEQKELAKQALCDTLLTYNKTLADSKAQNHIQNVRRDIFNNRPLKPAAIWQARQHLPASLAATLDSYLALVAGIQQAEENAGSVYQQVCTTIRLHLQQLATDENLQKGLVLSSQPLLQALTQYVQKNPGEFKKKEFQTEQSLLKYLTRMYTKTSPFSTFTSLAVSTLSQSASRAIQVGYSEGRSGQVVGHIRVNNQLFRYLKDLFAASREIYVHLRLRPNPTIAREAGQLVYLTNHQNVEAFQRIPNNAVLGLVLELMQQQPAGIRFSALVEQVCDYVDASEKAIEQYIRQLIGYGFVEFDLGVSGTDPDWDTKLIAELSYLQQQKVAYIDELLYALQEVRRLAGEYAFAAADKRQHLLSEAFKQFRGICMKLHEAAGLPEMERKTLEELQQALYLKRQEAEKLNKLPALEKQPSLLVAEREPVAQTSSEEIAFEHKSSTFFHFKAEQLFYEDATRELTIEYKAGTVKKFISALADLLQQLRLFQGMTDEREQMKQYFLQKYGAGNRISLLTFYEDFYRDIKRPEAQNQLQKRKETQKNTHLAEESSIPEKANPPTASTDKEDIPRQAQLKQWMQHMGAAFRNQAMTQKDQLEVSLGLLQQLNEQPLFQRNTKKESNSYGAFVQWYQEKDEAGEWQLKGVLNACFSGYGKMISRFLHVFPQEVTAATREWNRQLQGKDELFIENGDASYFNANLHPPLMPYEIRTPGGHTSLPIEKQLPVTEFDVCLDEEANELKLLHRPTGKRAYVFDLGFQGQGGRSPLFQLLDKFTKAQYLSVYPLLAAINKVTEKTQVTETHAGEKKIQVLPRIVYAESIILQRKAWIVSKEWLPFRQPGMSDWQYYAAIQTWRRAQEIPDEVYVKISSTRNTSEKEPEPGKKLGRDDYKPQYINFTDPLLVHLFEKLLGKVPESLKIEEMLPASHQVTQITNQPFVTECVVQWYDY